MVVLLRNDIDRCPPEYVGLFSSVDYVQKLLKKTYPSMVWRENKNELNTWESGFIDHHVCFLIKPVYINSIVYPQMLVEAK